MKEENAIEVRDVTKRFKVYFDKGSQLKERMLFWNRNRYEDRWVLKGISFNVKKGEAIGLIGHNGCGKSTTLKLLTKIIYPDAGSIEMRGRVSSLIELGAGFHPDMSGRENIYTNAAIFGLTKKEIDARLDDIIAFSELEEFIDNPVRTYSSGMYMRLAFSVAINVDADILLIDEILAVGDANFQAKCFNRLREIKSEGTTIVIVSHSLGQIEQICERSIWIHDGIIMAEGKPRDVHPEYLNYMGEQRQAIAEKEENRQKKLKEGKDKKEKVDNSEQETKQGIETDPEKVDEKAEKAEENKEEKNENQTKSAEIERWGNGNARITKISMLQENGRESTMFKTGSDVDVVIEYEVKKPVKDAVFGIGIFNSKGIQCYGTNTKIDRLDEFDLTKNGKIVIHFDKLNLLPEIYMMDVAIECEIGLPVDYFTKAYRFEMLTTKDDVGIARINHKWSINI